jgi:hypothetical protein
MHIIGTNDAFQRARRLRREMTKPERLLWWELEADKTGFHFRKQHAAGPCAGLLLRPSAYVRRGGRFIA